VQTLEKTVADMNVVFDDMNIKMHEMEEKIQVCVLNQFL
jgi:hypothetical protein